VRRPTLLVRLATRNLRRQLRRSLLTSAAMVLGVALLVFSRSLASGAHEDWIEAGVRLGTGHVAIQAPGYRARRTLDDRLEASDLERVRSALGAPAVARHVVERTTRLEVQGLASSANGAVPVLVMGVEPATERRFSRLAERRVEGDYLPADDPLAAYMGRELAERLDVGPGSRVVLTAQDATGQVVGQLVRVRGIFETGLPDVDERIVHIPLATARSWLSAGGAATTVALLLDASGAVDPVARALDEALSPGRRIAVLRWQEAMPELEAAVRMDDFGDYVFHAVTLAIVALAIINTILMSVLQRTREFGVVRALGMTRGETGAQVLVEGVLLSATSGLIGIALGFLVTWTFFRNGLDYSFLMEEGFRAAGAVIDPVVRPHFDLLQLVGSLLFVFIIGVGASLYPAWRATRIDVAEAMKFEA